MSLMTSGESVAWGRQACGFCALEGRLNNDGAEGAASRASSGVRVGVCVVDWLDRAMPLRLGRVGVGWTAGVRGDSDKVGVGGVGTLSAGARITVSPGISRVGEIRPSLPIQASPAACNKTDTEKALAKRRDDMALTPGYRTAVAERKSLRDPPPVPCIFRNGTFYFSGAVLRARDHGSGGAGPKCEFKSQFPDI